MNIDILNTLKNKGKPKQSPAVERAKQHIQNLIAKKIVNPQTLIRAGQLAEKGLTDPVMYQMAMQMALQNNLIKPEQMSSGKNYKALGIAITAGKLAEEIVNESK
jgi:hypothetical protein